MPRSRHRRLRSRPSAIATSSASGVVPASKGIQPLDRWALFLMVLLLVVLTVLVLSGDHAAARIRSFTWQDRQIGASDRAFLLNFSRPMDTQSVEEGLTITPPLSGKVSWAGRRMAYTLDVPAPYGETYTVTLNQAQDAFAAQENRASPFTPFHATFQTRPRAIAYIGTEGDEEGRLVLVNLTQQDRQVLTPKDLVVLDFKPYPLGDRLLLSATDAASYSQGEQQQQLYTVTTGIIPNPPPAIGERPQRNWQFWRSSQATPQAPGELTLVLDNQGYQNLKFDLSPDGETIVVQRVNRTNPADFGPWVVRAGAAPYRLQTEPGGDFLIAPDNYSLLMLQGEGTAVIPLEGGESEAAIEPLDFLPEYGRVFDLTSDGRAAAMVNFNQNDPERRYTQSLVLVTNQGEERELLQASGSIVDAQFDPTDQLLYVLASEVIPGEGYQEQPILSAINLQDATLTDLLLLPPQQDIYMSLSPDGLATLLTLRENQGEATEANAGYRVWLLPFFTETRQRLAGTPTQTQPEPMPFTGIKATWLP